MHSKRLGLNETASKRFEKLRRKKVDWTVSTSWTIGKICHIGNPILRWVRNLALKKTPACMTEKQLQRIYNLDQFRIDRDCRDVCKTDLSL